MMDDDQTDARIAALLSAPDPIPDNAFVSRIARAVLAEQHIAAARGHAWRRFAVESVASAAIMAAFYLLWRLSPELTSEHFPVAPSAAAILLLFLWFAVELRPAATER